MAPRSAGSTCRANTISHSATLSSHAPPARCPLARSAHCVWRCAASRAPTHSIRSPHTLVRAPTHAPTLFQLGAERRCSSSLCPRAVSWSPATGRFGQVNVVLLSVPGTLLPRTTTPFSRPSSRQPAFGPMQGDPRTRSDSPHVACQFLALPCTMLRCLLHQPRRPPSCSCPGRTYRDQCHSLGIVVRSCERTPSYQLAAAAVPARSCGASKHLFGNGVERTACAEGGTRQ